MSPEHSKPTVLIVEDDAALRGLYRDAFRVAGYDARGVADGMAALRRIINGTPPDAVVLDLALPRLGGRDVQREMTAHAETRHIPVVVVTGTDARDLATQVARVFEKPVEPEAVVRAVSESLGRTAASRPHHGGPMQIR